MMWTSIDTWIVIVAILSALACALPGCFLVLRKMSMMGDAISHAILPGLALAFLWTGSRDSLTMFIGAALVGVLTAVFVDWLNRFGEVEESASMGVVFTTLFAIGLILLVRGADQVDLDPGCVLYGALELVPLDTTTVGGLTLPRAALKLGAVLFFNIAFIVLFYKELLISTFDPSLSDTQGISARWMNLALMAVVAVTAVAAFESVGSILVIAMLIVPAATSSLLTDRLTPLIFLSCIVAFLAALLGHIAAITVPSLFGFEDTNTAGMMAVIAGFLFTLAVLFAPNKGLVSRVRHRLSLYLKVVEEDLLGLLYRLDEAGSTPPGLCCEPALQEALMVKKQVLQLVLWKAHRAGEVERINAGWHLTEKGEARARNLVRSHRIWEVYLDTHLITPHIHSSADRVEHRLNPRDISKLEKELSYPSEDPHGSPIPPGDPK